MSALTSIQFWPATGFPDRPWCEAPEVDAWVKSSRRVCELYSEAMVGRGLKGSVSLLQINSGPGDAENLIVNAFAESGHEGARVDVPRVVAQLGPLIRARLVLEVVDLAMRQIAAARGWSLEVLAQARQYVLDHGFHFAWTGREVTDPGRRRLARTNFSLADDGYGRVRVEVLDRASGAVLGASRPFLAYSTVEGFRRTSKSLRWTGRSRLSLVSYSDAFGIYQRSTVLDVDSDLNPPLEPPPQRHLVRLPTSPRVPRVELIGPPRPAVVGGSGGPMNDVPALYDATVGWIFDYIPAEVTAWWATTGLMELDVTYDYSGESTGVRLYRRGEDLHAWVRRPMPDEAASQDPIGTAHQDVTEVLLAVQRRFKLRPPPPLPLPSTTDLEEGVAAFLEIPTGGEMDLDLDLLRGTVPPEVMAVLEDLQNDD